MNSINQNQPEDNKEDLIGRDAVEKIQTLAKKASTCFFCTNISTGRAFSTRPMTAQEIDDQGNIWFLSAEDSKHIAEIKADAHVQLLFQGSEYSDYLNIYGTASVSKDKQRIEELWDAMYKTWFTEGKDDPRITVVKVRPLEGYYWDTKHNMAVGFFKRMVGAAIGKTLDDSIEGTVKP